MHESLADLAAIQERSNVVSCDDIMKLLISDCLEVEVEHSRPKGRSLESADGTRGPPRLKKPRFKQ